MLLLLLLPLYMAQARKLVLVDKASQKAERRQGKRDPEAVLRKRAKQRAKYIAKLVADGEPLRMTHGDALFIYLSVAPCHVRYSSSIIVLRCNCILLCWGMGDSYVPCCFVSITASYKSRYGTAQQYVKLVVLCYFFEDVQYFLPRVRAAAFVVVFVVVSRAAAFMAGCVALVRHSLLLLWRAGCYQL